MTILGSNGSGTVVRLAVALIAMSAAAHAEVVPSRPALGARACTADGASAAVAQPVRAGGLTTTSGIRPAAQVTRNDRADVTFEIRPSATGGVEVSGRSGDLRVTKTVQSSGEFVIELVTSRDKVSIAVTGQGTTVVRGKSNVRIARGGATSEGSEGKARRLLADSGAVLQLRGVAASLLEAEDRSPSSLAVIMADAMVGMLTGDVGAPRRIAQFLAHRANGNARPAGMALDCFSLMETRMVEAFDDYTSCYESVYPNPLYTNLCGYRWIIQVESYWFGFISCSGFNW